MMWVFRFHCYKKLSNLHSSCSTSNKNLEIPMQKFAGEKVDNNKKTRGGEMPSLLSRSSLASHISLSSSENFFDRPWAADWKMSVDGSLIRRLSVPVDLGPDS